MFSFAYVKLNFSAPYEISNRVNKIKVNINKMRRSNLARLLLDIGLSSRLSVVTGRIGKASMRWFVMIHSAVSVSLLQLIISVV